MPLGLPRTTLLALIPFAAIGQTGGPIRSTVGEPTATAKKVIQVLQTVPPEYTAQAQAARLQGTAVVSLDVTTDGRAENVRVRHGLGMGLDPQAVEAVQRWQFQTVEARTPHAITVSFDLNSGSPWYMEGTSWTVNRGNPPQRGSLINPVLTAYTPPADSLCADQPGFVVLNLPIDEQGVPHNVDVRTSVPYPPGSTVRQGVLAAAESWRFAPGLENGEPRPSSGQVVMACRPPESVAVQPDFNLYRVGNGVSAPLPIFKPEPDYSEEARIAKYQGEAVLSVIIEASGKVSDVRVVKSLGLGLDQEAMVAVLQWRFRPSSKEGKPVRVQALVSVQFRLL
jgi:TonB family protein